jgi:hypothetical protein
MELGPANEIRILVFGAHNGEMCRNSIYGQPAALIGGLPTPLAR